MQADFGQLGARKGTFAAQRVENQAAIHSLDQVSVAAKLGGHTKPFSISEISYLQYRSFCGFVNNFDLLVKKVLGVG